MYTYNGVFYVILPQRFGDNDFYGNGAIRIGQFITDPVNNLVKIYIEILPYLKVIKRFSDSDAIRFGNRVDFLRRQNNLRIAAAVRQ